MAERQNNDPASGGSDDITTPKPPRTRAKHATSATAAGTGAAESGLGPSTGASAEVPSASGQASRPENVSIVQGGADRVDADSVHVTQGGVTTVTAENVSVRQGGIATASAEDVSVTMGGIGIARADRVSVEMGGLGFAIAGQVRVTQGYARSVIARESHIEQGLVGTLITGRAVIERPTGVLLLVAGRVEGPVKAMFDWRGALAFGAAFGVVVGLLRRR